MHSRYFVGSSGGTTGGTTASLMMSNDDDSVKGCVTSVGTFDSQTDFCYTCGAGKSLGYCWNSQHPQCPPACHYMWGVADQGDNDCGKPCDSFLTDCSKVYVEAMCKGMGCTWHDNPLVSYCGDTFPL